jgi:hypothetical protein
MTDTPSPTPYVFVTATSVPSYSHCPESTVNIGDINDPICTQITIPSQAPVALVALIFFVIMLAVALWKWIKRNLV